MQTNRLAAGAAASLARVYGRSVDPMRSGFRRREFRTTSSIETDDESKARATEGPPATLRSTERFAVADGSIMEADLFVFWPDGEQEYGVIDPAQLDPKGVATARSLLMALSIDGTVVRGSVASGRAQTLTCLPPRAADRIVGKMQGVRITGEGDAPLAAVGTFGGHDDIAGRNAAARIIAGATGGGIQDIQSVLVHTATSMAIAIAASGAKTDPQVDEAYGLAIFLGVALSEGEGNGN